MNLFELNSHNLDSIYSIVRDGKSSYASEIKILCEQLWLQFQPFADSTFLTDLPNHFESRFWEMDLTCALLNHGYLIAKQRGLTPFTFLLKPYEVLSLSMWWFCW